MLIWLAETTVVAGILALVAIASSKSRRVGPSLRHMLWLVVLIKFVTPPIVSWPWATEWRGLDWPAASPQPAVLEVAASEPSTPMVTVATPEAEPISLESCSEAEDVSIEVPPVNLSEPAQLASTELPEADDEPTAEPTAETEPASVLSAGASVPAYLWPKWLSSIPLSRGLLIAWLSISATIGAGQLARILRFRRRLRGAAVAPDFLIDEADRIGRWLGVAVPEILVVDDLGTPMLWCLGRPQLLLPTHLVKTLPLERWRGVLTHELAHLRRRDHWVSRLELAAGLFWWWNPLYWLARSRLDAEAELACDAWVVWALPKDRLTYAEVLFDICSNLSLARPMAPALSVAGSGRFFERRLTMILHNDVPCRLSRLSFFAACLLVLCALPTWSVAKLVAVDHSGAPALLAAATDAPDASALLATLDDDDDDKDKKAAKSDDDDKDDDDDADDDNEDDDDDDDADDDDDQPERALSRARARAEAAQKRVKAIQEKLEKARAKADAKGKFNDKDKGNKDKGNKEKKSGDLELNFDFSKLGKEIESAFGPEFEKEMEKLGETIGKEMEKKFGPGSEFEQQMKKLGKEMEEKFGDGSEFAKKMEAFGKEMEKKFGPGSEFEEKMKKLGEEMKEKYGPGSDFAKKIEEKVSKASKAKDKGEAKAGSGSRKRRISELESQVSKLMEEIAKLKAQSDGDGEDD